MSYTDLNSLQDTVHDSELNLSSSPVKDSIIHLSETTEQLFMYHST